MRYLIGTKNYGLFYKKYHAVIETFSNADGNTLSGDSLSTMEAKFPPILIHCDTTTAIGRVKNHYYNGKSRHIRRKHSTVQSYLSSDIITVGYVKFNDNLADPFTKALTKDRV